MGWLKCNLANPYLFMVRGHTQSLPKGGSVADDG